MKQWVMKNIIKEIFEYGTRITFKGIKFEYSANGTAYTEVSNLQEIPSLGGTPEKLM